MGPHKIFTIPSRSIYDIQRSVASRYPDSGAYDTPWCTRSTRRIAALRGGGTVAVALQSYPSLLMGDGQVVDPLRAAGRGVNVHHRDARLAIGVMRDGRVLVALTRFEGLGGALSVLPFGFTTPEMAAIMGALGSARAVLLDGGISGQLLVRERGGEVHQWDALRKVPLGLLVGSRQPPTAP